MASEQADSALGGDDLAAKCDQAQERVKRAEHEHHAKDERERKKMRTKTPHILHQATLRKPTWTYLHLQLFTTVATSEPLDILTAKKYLDSALQRFLGLHGLAIPVDVLKLKGQDLWIRVPREDATVVHEAVASWTNGSERWVLKGRDEWLVRLNGGSGQELFKP